MLRRMLSATPLLFLIVAITWIAAYATMLPFPGWTAGTAVVLQPATSGGISNTHYLPTGATNQDATVVKSSAGQLYHITGSSTASYVSWLKLYDATSCTSASTPKYVVIIPANINGTGFNSDLAVGMAFSTGICFRVTQGQADSDATAVTSGYLSVEVGYN